MLERMLPVPEPKDELLLVSSIMWGSACWLEELVADGGLGEPPLGTDADSDMSKNIQSPSLSSLQINLVL